MLVLLGVATHSLVVRAVDGELDAQLRFHAEVVATRLLEDAPDDDAVRRVVESDPQVTSITVRDPGGTVRAGAGTAGSLDPRHRIDLDDGTVVTVRQDATAVRTAATELTRRLTLLIGGGLLVLWLLVVPLAWRLGRDLRGQADTLREQRDELAAQGAVLREQRDELEATGRELQRLLDQEQVTVRRLREVDELREQFLNAVSHELRTPMTVIKGSLQLLHENGDRLPERSRRDLLTRARKKAARLEELVMGLLEMNQSMEPATDGRTLDLVDAVRMARAEFPRRTVELDLEVARLDTSPTRLGRALQQLLGNSVRHAPDAPRTVVRTRATGGGVELVVEDAGPGVPDDLKVQAFEPFAQGELLDPHNPGLGMGLTIVARYAAEHEGRAWISDTPGGGTRVHVLLPDTLPDDPGDPARTTISSTVGAARTT